MVVVIILLCVVRFVSFHFFFVSLFYFYGYGNTRNNKTTGGVLLSYREGKVRGHLATDHIHEQQRDGRSKGQFGGGGGGGGGAEVVGRTVCTPCSLPQSFLPRTPFTLRHILDGTRPSGRREGIRGIDIFCSCRFLAA